MKFFSRILRPAKNSKGQTMVEYILLILVVVVIMKSLFGKLNEFLITNPDSLQNKYLKGYASVFSAGGDGVDGNFKRFRMVK